MNDGSTDNSAEILSEYSTRDSRIKVFTQENSGLSAARNRALEHATGEWVTGVDSDDWLECDAYERVMRDAVDEVDMVIFGARIDSENATDESNPLIDYCRVKLQGTHDLSHKVCRELNVYFWNKIYRLSIIRKFGIRFPVGVYFEDMKFYYSYAGVAGKVACNPYPAYHYWQHGDSIMAQAACKSFIGMDHLRVVDSLYDFYEKNGLLNKYSSLYEQLFAEYYNLSLQFTPQEMHTDVHRMAYALAVKSGVIHKKRLPQIRLLKGMFMPTMEKFFHWYTDNRECFGVLGRSIYSITYGEKCTVHRMMGKVIKKVPVEEFA